MDYIFQESDGAWQLAPYLDYLRGAAASFPDGARAFATAPWHYRMGDRMCPHDGWMETLTISEGQVGPKKADRAVDIAARFLGAYHDRHLDIRYASVVEYHLTYAKALSSRAQRHGMHLMLGHGDWLIDEVTVTPDNLVRHEILFREGGAIIVLCKDLTFSWTELPA